MKAVIQRVKKANVKVNEKVIGRINNGLFVLLGIGKEDSEKEVILLTQKIAKLRIMADKQGKMNLNVQDVKGEILVVSQFTLYGDCRGQNRPSFITAADPEKAKNLYELFISQLKNQGIPVKTGSFGEHMEIELLADGPVTIVLEN